MNRFPFNNAWRIILYRTEFCCFNRPFTVNRLPKWINDAAKQSIPDGNLHNLPCAFDLITFTNIAVWPQNNNPNVAFFQVQRKTKNAVFKLE
ncbi:hypothetical protein D3C77_637350 [compost metagenome]